MSGLGKQGKYRQQSKNGKVLASVLSKDTIEQPQVSCFTSPQYKTITPETFRLHGKTKIMQTPFRKVSVVPRRLKLTEYFVKRRSNRSSHESTVLPYGEDLINKIRNGVQDGLQIRNFEGKGRGVIATKDFTSNEFVVEYSGELLTRKAARARETAYSEKTDIGCFLYFFQYRGSGFCVDATKETDRLGRLINHSKNGNLFTKVVEVQGAPKLIFFAKRSIKIGEELSYDYGDRRREVLKHHSWLSF